MKVKNKTNYSTRAIAALVRAVGKKELWSKDYFRDLVVYVHPRLRERGCHGYAPYGGTYFTVYLHRTDTPRMVAKTIAHEAAHNHGVKHRRMHAALRWGGEEHWGWADAFPLPLKTQKAKTPKLRLLPNASKLAHAEHRLAQAKTRAKRASTIMKKWQGKVRYYQKKLAAQEAPAQP